jgi:hypothetical protein
VPLIEVSAGTPTIKPGTYLADVIGIAPKALTTRFSKPGQEDDFLEWTWNVHTPQGDEELRSLTSVATGPKSRIFEYLVALLGADKVSIGMGFEEDDLIGKSAQVTVITNDDGFSKLERVTPMLTGSAPAAPKAAPTAAPAAAAQTGDDDLPF